MKPYRARASQVIDASPEAVYRVLSDYHEHPRILPKPYFESVVVEQGGKGAGTVVRVGMRVLGTRTALCMTVTEPEPGRVLQEADAVAGVATTFTVDPVDGGARSRVEIATEWEPKAGLVGLVERLVNPLVARALYGKELAILADYVRS